MDPGSSAPAAIVWLLTSLLFYVAAVAAEAILDSVRRRHLRSLTADQTVGGTFLERLIDTPARYRNSLEIVQLAAVASAIVATIRIADAAATVSVWPLIIAVFVVLLLGRSLAKILGPGLTTPIAPAVAIVVEGITLLITPVRLLKGLLEQFVGVPKTDEEPRLRDLSEEELKVLADVVRDKEVEGVLDGKERKMISRIFDLGQTTVREVMVPRLDIVALDAGTPLDDAVDTIVEGGHSRIPVYEESIDAVIGVLYAKDLLVYLQDGQSDVSIRDILRDPVFVPESKKLDEFLQDLQQSHIHIAIVVDEYGGTAGLATIEDVLEEIVGEIQDEYDVEEPFIQLVSDHEAVCNARVDLDDLNRVLDLDLPTDEYDTLGGLIYSALGRVPKVSDEVHVDGAILRVMTVNGQRIKKVRVRKTESSLPRDGHQEKEPARDSSQKPANGELGLIP